MKTRESRCTRARLYPAHLLNLEARLSLGHIVKSFGMNQLAAIKHHTQKAGAAGNAVRDAARNVRHLPWVKFQRTPFGVVQ